MCWGQLRHARCAYDSDSFLLTPRRQLGLLFWKKKSPEDFSRGLGVRGVMINLRMSGVSQVGNFKRSVDCAVGSYPSSVGWHGKPSTPVCRYAGMAEYFDIDSIAIFNCMVFYHLAHKTSAPGIFFKR